jgi:hypothetical protein
MKRERNNAFLNFQDKEGNKKYLYKRKKKININTTTEQESNQKGVGENGLARVTRMSGRFFPLTSFLYLFVLHMRCHYSHDLGWERKRGVQFYHLLSSFCKRLICFLTIV